MGSRVGLRSVNPFSVAVNTYKVTVCCLRTDETTTTNNNNYYNYYYNYYYYYHHQHYYYKQRRRGLKIGGQEVAIFRQRTANFKQGKL